MKIRVRRRALIVPLLGLAFGSLLSGCPDAINIVEFYDEDAGDVDAGSDASDEDAGDEDAGPSTNGGDGGCELVCEADCVPLRPGDFSFPLLAWIGPDESSAPPCPDAAPVEQFVWHGDPIVPPFACGECSCGPSVGFCSLPSSMAAQDAPCASAEGAAMTPTDPPEFWDGTCAPDNAIPADACSTSNPCIQSVTIGPLSITDEACTASGTSTAPLETASWGLFARLCEGITSTGYGGCSPAELCVPTREEGFRQCVQRPGIHDCPAEGYSERFVLYEDFNDTRACSPCTCGAPEGSACGSKVSFHADSTCTSPSVSADASSAGPTCLDLTTPGEAIGAKSATAPVYHSGTCQAHGGELLGAVEFLGPRTLCCLP